MAMRHEVGAEIQGLKSLLDLSPYQLGYVAAGSLGLVLAASFKWVDCFRVEM